MVPNLPKLCLLQTVPTLPANLGSEMNSGGVVTRKSTQAKLSFRSPYALPQFSGPSIRIKLLACRRAS